MKILVVGAGARQHALCWKFAMEPGVERVIVAPGNPLMTDVAEVRPEISDDDLSAIVALALAERVDLVVVGGEDPLVAGLADLLAAAGVACFGPTATAARLEGSKAFAREVCDAAGIAMAKGRAWEDAASAIAFAEGLGGRVVVKADGLAEGKGVTMCADFGEAEAAVREALVEGRFGHAGRRVVVEEWLDGSEASVFALCDGERYALLPAARDHKRAGEGDTGPNTGGMGAYSPVAELDDRALSRIGESVVAPVLAEMTRRGTPFRGALFCGLMLTADGPRVLEFNVRLGDPETQAIMPRIGVPLANLMLECANGRLSVGGLLPELPDAAVALFMVADGYPDSGHRGDRIAGVAAARETGALVFGAGVALGADGEMITSRGRVLTVVGRGATVGDAADAAYAAASRIDYDGDWYRRDIGRPLVGARA
ncbi:MAG: phosphoribosylamine--glycine ligase [Chloroflexota bacterium]